MKSPFVFADTPLKSGPVSNTLTPYKIGSFYHAVEWVWKLPYGRNSDRSNYLLVPKEQRGACSTKHAFLAALAQELGIELKLTVGIFLMNGINTPKISQTLSESKLNAVPEAHSYLKFGEQRYDFTTFDLSNPFYGVDLDLLHEEEILPNQIGDYKIKLHQRWIQDWLSANPKIDMSFDEVWTLREFCIQVLSEPERSEDSHA